MTQPVYDVTVRLDGEDGNAFAILGRVRKALRRAGVPESDIKNIMEEATSDDYFHLINTVMKYVDVE
jgi:hypothetical protein